MTLWWQVLILSVSFFFPNHPTREGTIVFRRIFGLLGRLQLQHRFYCRLAVISLFWPMAHGEYLTWVLGLSSTSKPVDGRFDSKWDFPQCAQIFPLKLIFIDMISMPLNDMVGSIKEGQWSFAWSFYYLLWVLSVWFLSTSSHVAMPFECKSISIFLHYSTYFLALNLHRIWSPALLPFNRICANKSRLPARVSNA